MINNEQGDLDKLKKLALADNAIIRRLAAILTVRNSCDKQRVALSSPGCGDSVLMEPRRMGVSRKPCLPFRSKRPTTSIGGSVEVTERTLTIPRQVRTVD
jgi:hypothetical protein